MKTLSVESNWAALDITTQHAKLQISNNISRRLKVTVIRPQMVVDRKAPSFKLDSGARPRRAGSLVYLKQYLLKQNKKKILDALNKSIRQGYALEKLYGSNMLTQSEPAVQLDLSQSVSVYPEHEEMEPSAPEIEWDPGYFKVDWIAGEIKIEWEENTKPDIQVAPHSVEIRVKGKKSVRIALNEDKLPYRTGRKVNKGV